MPVRKTLLLLPALQAVAGPERRPVDLAEPLLWRLRTAGCFTESVRHRSFVNSFPRRPRPVPHAAFALFPPGMEAVHN